MSTICTHIAPDIRHAAAQILRCSVNIVFQLKNVKNAAGADISSIILNILPIQLQRLTHFWFIFSFYIINTLYRPSFRGLIPTQQRVSHTILSAVLCTTFISQAGGYICQQFRPALASSISKIIVQLKNAKIATSISIFSIMVNIFLKQLSLFTSYLFSSSFNIINTLLRPRFQCLIPSKQRVLCSIVSITKSSALLLIGEKHIAQQIQTTLAPTNHKITFCRLFASFHILSKCCIRQSTLTHDMVLCNHNVHKVSLLSGGLFPSRGWLPLWNDRTWIFQHLEDGNDVTNPTEEETILYAAVQKISYTFSQMRKCRGSHVDTTLNRRNLNQKVQLAGNNITTSHLKRIRIMQVLSQQDYDTD